jgi:hypothetical protein
MTELSRLIWVLTMAAELPRADVVRLAVEGIVEAHLRERAKELERLRWS